ncbi:glutamine synthetase family protein [Streptantibioticus silvisoli]|uniref:Glutamine synthetase family protein n=1 Tax=Streptantibioticus silvisoli TaxID=2705255 RepID=A0ABT6VYK9_9ACTN|nr:glutamine synthetase family protein [Streptantibioticus silvisoli]MDI5963250.1 glutamine synthetase family protein [Streptantibioticus silvisoli]
MEIGLPGSKPGEPAVGRRGFVCRHDLDSAERQEAVQQVSAQITELGLRTVRAVVVDQHGVSRTKFLSAEAAISAFSHGVNFSSAIYQMDTGNNVFTAGFEEDSGIDLPELTGFPDVMAVPDPETFRVLPWTDRSGWMLCDTYLGSGRRNPLCGRGLLRQQLAQLAQDGMRYVAGLEVEFLVVRRASSQLAFAELGHPPPVPGASAVECGYQFLSENRLDGAHEVVEPLRDALWEVGLRPRTMENEWGPGQFEFTFAPMEGLDAADAMILFRSTVKQVCARRGMIASFMSVPTLPHAFPSGWHLHSSLVDGRGRNLFADETRIPSGTALHYLAGQLEHAGAMAAFATPTLNGYRRYRPYSFAPARTGWSVDNRGALIRVVGGAGDPGSHLENRLGEPCANPYLYMAADIAAGRDGMTRQLRPPPPAVTDPYGADGLPLPADLSEAVARLERSALYRAEFGDVFTDYFVKLKRAEITRRAEAVQESPGDVEKATADWEMREYFEFF